MSENQAKEKKLKLFKSKKAEIDEISNFEDTNTLDLNINKKPEISMDIEERVSLMTWASENLNKIEETKAGERLNIYLKSSSFNELKELQERTKKGKSEIIAKGINVLLKQLKQLSK